MIRIEIEYPIIVCIEKAGSIAGALFILVDNGKNASEARLC
jgi:hypothetical protein